MRKIEVATANAPNSIATSVVTFRAANNPKLAKIIISHEMRAARKVAGMGFTSFAMHAATHLLAATVSTRVLVKRSQPIRPDSGCPLFHAQLERAS
jgi:phosphate starvation-inducible protein PhoH